MEKIEPMLSAGKYENGAKRGEMCISQVMVGFGFALKKL